MTKPLLPQTDYQTIFQDWQNELTAAIAGEKTNLPFIKHQLPKSTIVQNGELFQVLVIGGTMFKSAVLKKINEEIRIESEINGTLPNFSTKDIFLEFVRGQYQMHDKLTVSFAYPIKPVFTTVLDGVLLAKQKQHAFDGLVGETIGVTIATFLKQKQNMDVTVSVANDAICLLLSGLTQDPWQSVSAAIVGTGLGAAIFLDQTTIVNLEPGQFNKFERSLSDRFVDNKQQQSGDFFYEKALSGRYLWEHFNYYREQLHIDYEPITDSEQLSVIASEEKGSASELAREILIRSASLAACMIAAIATMGSKPKNIVMQGSLFWNGFKYRDTVEQMLANLLGEDHGIQLIHIDNADILGAAKLIA